MQRLGESLQTASLIVSLSPILSPCLKKRVHNKVYIKSTFLKISFNPSFYIYTRLYTFPSFYIIKLRFTGYGAAGVERISNATAGCQGDSRNERNQDPKRRVQRGPAGLGDQC